MVETGTLGFSQALAGKFDAIGVVHQAVENGIGDGRTADDLVPMIDRHLAGDDDGACLVTILDDLEQIPSLIGIEGFGPQSSRMSRSRRASERNILA